MLTNLTPAQLAALAAEIGITPETHRHLSLNVVQPGTVQNGFRCSRLEIDPDKLPNPFATDPAEARAADNVWLGPLLWFATGHVQLVKLMRTTRTGISLDGKDKFGKFNFSGPILRGLYGRGVPEIVAAVEGDQPMLAEREREGE